MILRKINCRLINKVRFLTNQINLKANMSTLPKVLVTRCDAPEESITLLQSKCEVEIWNKPGPMPREDLLMKIKGKNGIFCMLSDKINSEFLETAGPSLKVVGTYSVGYDHIDIEKCKERSVLVGNTPNVLTDATAELTVALLLATSRRIVEASKEVTNGGWSSTGWSPTYMCGKALAGSTVGIVGLGRIGFGVAERLKAFKVKNIIYSGNKAKTEAMEKLNAKLVPFEELLKQSDFVVVCCALTPNTKGLFNLEAFKKMKRDAIFVNCSRGAVVNHDDLYEALSTGLIQSAGLDVMDPEPLPADHKLTSLSNCVLLPHIGSATVDTRITMGILTVKNILAGLDGKPLPCPVI